jgi:hypothetical protein
VADALENDKLMRWKVDKTVVFEKMKDKLTKCKVDKIGSGRSDKYIK